MKTLSSSLKSRTRNLLFYYTCFFFSFCLLCKSVSAQKPSIVSFSPAKGAVGTTVTITGANFSPVAGNNIVYFGDVKAVVTSATSSSISVVVPAGATYRPLSVTSNGLIAYASSPFHVIFPGGGSAFTANSFSPKSDSLLGFNPTSLGASDLDGDGRLDVVIAGGSSNIICVLKNNSVPGSIAFLPKVNYTTGNSPVSVAFGDLDGDGKQDLVVVNSKDNTISIFRNNSVNNVISFLPKIDINTGTSPANCSISDVDNDGKADLICTNSGNNTVSVFRNTTVGNSIAFASKVDLATGKEPFGVTAIDLNGDALPEIGVANQNDTTVSIYRNRSVPGTLLFEAGADFKNYYKPSLLAAADVDGDGKIDLVTGSGASALFTVSKNVTSAGTIAFAPAVFFPTGFGASSDLSLGDADGDGSVDVAVNHELYSTISLVKNLSRPDTLRFASRVDYYVTSNSASVMQADLDGDGRPDLMATNPSGTLSLFRNIVPKPYITSVSPNTAGSGAIVTITGNNFNTTSAVRFGGVLASSFIVESPTTITAVVDAGSSGEVAVTTDYGTAAFSGFTFNRVPSIKSFTPTLGGNGTVLTINGTNFTETTAVTVGGVPVASFTVVSPSVMTATVGTVPTGLLDVVVTTSFGTANLPGFYTGVAVQNFYPTSGPVGTIVTINGTHFSANPSDNIVYFGSVRATVLSATPTSLSVSVPSGTTFQPVSVTVNNLTAYSGQPFVATFKGTGNEFTASSFSKRLDSAASNYPIYISIADLNNDGKSDVITSNFAAGSISVSKNRSSNVDLSFQYKVDYATAKPYVWSSATGDLDGDGKTDVVAVTGDNTVSFDRSFSIFKNVSTADSIILSKTDYPIGIMNSNPRYSLITDFDGDGKPDLAFLSFSGMAILRNTTSNGTISFAPKMDLFLNISAESQIAYTDVDGDGQSDLVIVGNSENVYVIRNTSKPGQISFAQPMSILAGSAPRSVSVGDFDNDGKPDLAVLNAGNN